MATFGTSVGFVYNQETPSDTWVISHNLNTNAPVVDCWVNDDGNLRKIFPLSVSVTSSNTVTVTFSTPYAGKAYVI